MKKLFLTLLFILFLSTTAQAADTWSSGQSHFYSRRGLIGGGTALDALSGLSMCPNDYAITLDISGNSIYFHQVSATGNSSGTTAETVPFWISPNSSDSGNTLAGVSMWKLCGISGDTGYFKTLVIDARTVKGTDIDAWNIIQSQVSIYVQSQVSKYLTGNTAYGPGANAEFNGVSTFGVTVYGTSGATIATRLNASGVSTVAVNYPDSRGYYNRLGNLTTALAELSENTVLFDGNSYLTCSGGVLTYTVESNSGATSFNFGSVITGLPPDTTSIALTAGTTTVPVENWVYWELDGGKPTLKKSTTEPTGDVAHAAVFLVGYVSDTYYQIYGYNRRRDETPKFFSRSLNRTAHAGTLYKSGLSTTATSGTIGIAGGGEFFDNLVMMTTSNSVTATATSSSACSFYMVDHNGAFQAFHSLSGLSVYSDGSPIVGNDRQNIVWGVVPTSTTEGGAVPTTVKLFAVVQGKPATVYGSDAAARADAEDLTNYYPPNDRLKMVFVPVARTILQVSTPEFKEFSTGVYYKDLRGKITSGGGAAVSVDLSAYSLLSDVQSQVSQYPYASQVTPWIDSRVSPYATRTELSTYTSTSPWATSNLANVSGQTKFAGTSAFFLTFSVANPDCHVNGIPGGNTPFSLLPVDPIMFPTGITVVYVNGQVTSGHTPYLFEFEEWNSGLSVSQIARFTTPDSGASAWQSGATPIKEGSDVYLNPPATGAYTIRGSIKYFRR